LERTWGGVEREGGESVEIFFLEAAGVDVTAEVREADGAVSEVGGVSRAEKWEARREEPAERKRVLWRPGWVGQARRCTRWAGGGGR